MVKKGYKQTEVGVIPEDWDCTTAKRLMKIETGSRNTENKTDTGIYPFFVRSQKIESIDTYYYNCEAVLTAGDGVGTGKVFHYYIGKFDAHQRVYVMSDFDRILGKYFYYYFCENFEDEVSKYTAKSSVDSVRHYMIAEMKIPLPPLPEQRRIAEALSDMDSMISSLEKLVAKYKSIKAACLQQMFPQNGETVPRMRLPGFTDAWEQRELSEGVSEIGDGLHGTPIYCEDGNVYFINGINLVDGKILIGVETKKVNESHQSMADKSLDDTTILMSINGTIGNLAYYSGEKLMLGKSAAYIKVSEFDKRFVYAYLQAPSVQGYFMDSLTGTTIKNLGLKAIREMIMPIPQDVDEQKRIGEFFDTLDHLITLHQRKLEKIQKIKQGMMQQLLTGKIRLV